MKFIIFSLLAVTTLRGAFPDVQLVSSGPGTLRPGENLNLVCKVTSVSITSSTYTWDWIRQPPGKGLEWVAEIYPYDGTKRYNPSLQSRTTISSENSQSKFSLQLNSMTVADSAVYYCVRRIMGYDYLDYWGSGTSVTVTTASQTAPSLFPLIPCVTEGSGDIVTIGCLAKEFLPDTLTLSWQKPDNSSLEEGKSRRFPSIANSNGANTASSEATVPAGQWDNFQPFFCKAVLASETRVTRVVRQTSIEPPEPVVVVRVPPLEDFQTASLNASLLCKASSLHTERTAIKWLEGGNVLNSGFTTFAAIRQGNTYSIISELIITKRDWYADKTFSCQVLNEKISEIRNVSKLSVCGDGGGTNVPVRVETIPPSFQDIFLTKSAKLTCRISNIPFSQDPAELNITWIRQRDNKPLDIKIAQPEEQENKELVFVDATTTICAEEWDSGDNFQCKVSFPLLASTETKSLKKENGGSRSPPSTYVLTPPLEQLALREMATLTCLAKDFYPADCFFQWLQNGEPVEESKYYTSRPVLESKSPERYSASSTLNVKEESWNHGDTYTCVVGHEALPLQTTQKTIDKNTGKPTHVNVSLVLSDATSTCY